MDKYDEVEDDMGDSPEEGYGEPGIARRWSDGSAEDA
jgi:hypothetical protein